MSKKTVKQIINILCIFVLLIMVFSPFAYASNSKNNQNSGSSANSADQWMSQGNTFIQNGEANSKLDTNKIKDALMPIGRALVVIATITLTVVTVIMAIKYMMCDTADKKAKLKTQLIGLVVSTIVIYGAQIIWSLVYDFMTSVTTVSK